MGNEGLRSDHTWRRGQIEVRAKREVQAETKKIKNETERCRNTREDWRGR